MPIFTISQINSYLKESLDSDPLLGDIWVTAEVSNVSTSVSGHTFFTLKDIHSQLRCVVFKGGNGAKLLSNGCAITAHGRISFYEVRGTVDLIADIVMPEGTGALTLQFEQLKMRLEAAGLFQESRKRRLPSFPTVIGLVTSPTGAVIGDIQKVLARRYPLVQLLVAPTAVQGEHAATGIAEAIKQLNDDGTSDVIILARGGGSLEELWAFNEETVAQAIYSSIIPIVSAVGHERDYTISDYVADLRAPTPSIAAELVVPDAITISRGIRDCEGQMSRALSSYFLQLQERLSSLQQRAYGRVPDIMTLKRRVDDLNHAASMTLHNYFDLRHQVTSSLRLRLDSLNPQAILCRGYALVEKTSSGQSISRKNQVTGGEALNITVSDGIFHATVGDSAQGPQRTPSGDRATKSLL